MRTLNPDILMSLGTMTTIDTEGRNATRAEPMMMLTNWTDARMRTILIIAPNRKNKYSTTIVFLSSPRNLAHTNTSGSMNMITIPSATFGADIITSAPWNHHHPQGINVDRSTTRNLHLDIGAVSPTPARYRSSTHVDADSPPPERGRP